MNNTHHGDLERKQYDLQNAYEGILKTVLLEDFLYNIVLMHLEINAALGILIRENAHPKLSLALLGLSFGLMNFFLAFPVRLVLW